MKELILEAASGRSRIAIGSGAISGLSDAMAGRRALIVTDSNVGRLHSALFPQGAEVMGIGLGEESKTLETVESIYSRMLELELDRSSLIIGIGGGIVCDVAGYAATTYLRGMGLVLAPTTLLAQVDAAIGGKNGVNYKGYKNLVGTFRQPEAVLCDIRALRTLPTEEMRNGYAEVVKQAAIGDADAFAYLEERADEALRLQEDELERMVSDSAAIKAAIVQADEKEAGERMKLNYGHTIGHAIEKVAKVRHGEAVAAGMIAEADISVSKGMMERKDRERLSSLIGRLGLPVSVDADRELIIDAIRKDKKRRGGGIRMPVLDGIGKARIVDVTLEEMKDAIRDMP